MLNWAKILSNISMLIGCSRLISLPLLHWSARLKSQAILASLWVDYRFLKMRKCLTIIAKRLLVFMQQVLAHLILPKTVPAIPAALVSEKRPTSVAEPPNTLIN